MWKKYFCRSPKAVIAGFALVVGATDVMRFSGETVQISRIERIPWDDPAFGIVSLTLGHRVDGSGEGPEPAQMSVVGKYVPAQGRWQQTSSLGRGRGGGESPPRGRRRGAEYVSDGGHRAARLSAERGAPCPDAEASE